MTTVAEPTPTSGTDYPPAPPRSCTARRTSTHMWVDSPESRAGGRELWGYPKERAEFELAIGSAGGTVQPLRGGLVAVRALFRSRPSVGRGSFTLPPGSPLAFVDGARKLISIGMRDFDFTFGV